MPNAISLQFALSVLIRSVDNLIKIAHLANFTFHLYKNIILFISPG